jgi:hypothetical protein
MYHGNLFQDDSATNIDVATAAPADAPVDWHMSNLALTPDGKYLLAVTVQGINSEPSLVFQPWRWDWNGFGKLLYTSKTTWSNLNSLDHTNGSISDTIFGYSLLANSDGTASLGLTLNGDISFYTFRYEAFDALHDASTGISRSLIPPTEYFFAGQKLGLYKENIYDAPNPGMGGDVNFNRAGDSIVFITHPINDLDFIVKGTNNRTKYSGVYLYTNGSAQLIYNDTNAQELQPVIMKVAIQIPHYGGITMPVPTVPAADTAGSSSFNVAIYDTSAVVDETIDSVVLSGPNASEFKVNATFPQALAKNTSLSVPITFSPVGTPGVRNAMVKAYFAGRQDSVRQAILTGTAKAVPLKGVPENTPLAIGMTVEPNPFNASTSVMLIAPEAGTLGIVVHDALGRTVYTSDVKRVAAGASETFAFDAKSLALPNGVYYVSVIFGDREVSRQVVFVR